jgi:hypothetical protein
VKDDRMTALDLLNLFCLTTMTAGIVTITLATLL